MAGRTVSIAYWYQVSLGPIKQTKFELSREKATAVFRILQEILTNVLRHAQANNHYVKLCETKSTSRWKSETTDMGLPRVK